MRPAIEERSGTAKKDEDADACEEEIQVCDICGDAGYDDELAICSRCNDSAEHIYCMTTMHDTIPLQWVCEGCKLEEKKGSEKKRFACSEPLPTQTCKKQITNKLFSHSAVENFLSVQQPSLKPVSFESRTCIPSVLLNGLTENVKANFSPPSKILFAGKVACSNKGIDERVSGVETQAHQEPNMSRNLSSSSSAEHPLEAFLSTPQQGCEAFQEKVLSSPTLLGPSGCLKAAASGETNIRQAFEIRVARESASKSNVPKVASDYTKCPADGPILGSKHVFSRSVSMKSYDDQPSFLLPSRPKNLTRSKSAVVLPSAGLIGDLRNKSSDRGHDNDLHRATHKKATRGTSCMTDRTKSTLTGLRPYRQDGQDSMKYEQSSRNLESLQPWRHNTDSGKETHIPSSRDSDSLQRWSGDGRETRRCYKCDEVGHIAARCKNVSSSRRGLGGSRALACSEKTMAGKNSAPERPWNFHSNEEDDSIKECPMWKSHDADCSGTCSTMSYNTSKKTKMYGNERLGTTDTESVGLKHSPKSFENGLVHEKQIAETISFKKSRQWSVEGSGMPEQTQGVDPMIIKHLQEPQQNQVILPSPWNKSGSVRPEADTAVGTIFESHCEIQAEPCIEILWSGCFNVSSNNCLNKYNGLQAHLSSKADPKVFEAVKTLPFELHLKELKRGVETDTWPWSLQEQPLTSNSIGVYFFPVDMDCHDIWYKPLLDHLCANDLALRTRLDFFQLLIFPSQLLPESDQYWDDRKYLWGVLEDSSILRPEAL